MIPPTPPPDIDLPLWHTSLELLTRWRPERLAMTHFGSVEDVESHIAELSRRLDLWGEIALANDQDGFAREIMAELRTQAPAELINAYEQAAPVAQLYAGLRRDWTKQGALPTAWN